MKKAIFLGILLVLAVSATFEAGLLRAELPATPPVTPPVVPTPTPLPVDYNHQPVIVTESLPVAYSGYPYSGEIVVYDPDGDLPNVLLFGLPANLTFNGCSVKNSPLRFGTSSRLIVCRIGGTTSFMGSHPIIVTATDAKGGFIQKTLNLNVVRLNRNRL